MWRGESRGGLLLLLFGLLLLLVYLPEPPPGETGGGRPLEAGRSGAQRPRAGRASRGARGPEEVRARGAWNRGKGTGATAVGG